MNDAPQPPSNPPSAAELKAPSIEEELKEVKDKYLRLLADMDNMRKRMQKEKLEGSRFAIESAIAEFLDPIDNLENALNFAQGHSDETRNWALGFQMILAQFKEVLHRHNVISFHSEGASFDPHLHEAVEIEETTQYPEGKIIKEFVRGYKSGDRTLRPARVKVAKAPQPSNKSTEQTP